MQDRYAGDIGDFVKYGLLRAIRGTRRLGVAWYLHPDAGPAGDGRHIAYLHDPDRWRHLDPELFDALRDMIRCDRRSVANIRESGILGDAVFAADSLALADVKVRDRKRWRRHWFDRIRRQLAGCDLVFADPDNGLVRDDRFKPTRQVSSKSIPLAEAMDLAEERTAVIYHHNTREKGGHIKEIQWWKDQLPEGTMAYYWRRVSNRTFFVINPDGEIRRRVTEFAELWGDRGELDPGEISRRKLDPESARAMVRVREARRAYRKFYAMCFWSYRRDLRIGPVDVDWVAETLKKNGDMSAWRAAGRIVGAGDQATHINWSRDSAWRFMPLVQLDDGGLALHEVDLAINKVLALASREEARDFVDILYAHEHILPLGALCWAAVAKDPGFSPASLLERLKRRGRYRPEEIDGIEFAAPLDLVETKAVWRAAISDADKFIRERPHEEVGCLYYSPSRECFVAPSPDISVAEQGLVARFGQSGGQADLSEVEAVRPRGQHPVEARDDLPEREEGRDRGDAADDQGDDGTPETGSASRFTAVRLRGVAGLAGETLKRGAAAAGRAAGAAGDGMAGSAKAVGGRVGDVSVRAGHLVSESLGRVPLRRLSEPLTAGAANFGNALLATDVAVTLDRWTRAVFASGQASPYDRALDLTYNTLKQHGGDHRIFDGSHDPIGAWKTINETFPDEGWLDRGEGYVSALWKDMVTPNGIPVVTWDKGAFDTVAGFLNETLGVSRHWSKDMVTFTATEFTGAVLGGLALVLSWNNAETRRFAEIVASLGLSAVVGANPLMVMVTIVGLAKCFHEARHGAGFKRVLSGGGRGMVGTTALLGASRLMPTPAWVTLVLGVVSYLVATKLYDKAEPKAEELGRIVRDWFGSREWNESCSELARNTYLGGRP